MAGDAQRAPEIDGSETGRARPGLIGIQEFGRRTGLTGLVRGFLSAVPILANGIHARVVSEMLGHADAAPNVHTRVLPQGAGRRGKEARRVARLRRLFPPDPGSPPGPVVTR